MADGLLKLCGEPSVPGLALPKAFESLERHIETAANLCKLKGSHESQVAGLLIVCGELQRLLRLAFIENGILASRIEMLSCYQDDFIRRCERKLRVFDTEQKVNRRYLKKLRQRQSIIVEYETVRKRKDQVGWEVDVTCSDYDTMATLSRMSGNPNLEFMLRINQLLLDFVKDSNCNELCLPPMGFEERAELSKLASLYKLRCRFHKSTQVASSTIIKARQTTLPGPGEIDNLLNAFTKRTKDGDVTIADLGSPKNETDRDDGNNTMANPPPLSKEASSSSVPVTEGSSDPPLLIPVTNIASSSKGIITKDENTLPSYMLTPVSSIGTPTITLEGEPPPPVPFVQNISKMKPSPIHGEGGMAENPLPRLPKMMDSVNTDTVAAAHALFKQLLPDTFEPSTSTRGINIPISKSQPVTTASMPSPYTNLYPSSSIGSSPSALQMALMMQSQQLRALSAAAAAVTGGQTTPLPVSSSHVTPPSSGMSTVLATPLPLSLSSKSTSVKRDGGEHSGSTGGTIKRSKITRRSYTTNEQTK